MSRQELEVVSRPGASVSRMSLLLNERYTNGKAETVHSPISLRVGNNMQITFIRSQVVADHYAIVSIRLDLTCPKFKVF